MNAQLKWMRIALVLAAAYHVGWGLYIIRCPLQTMHVAGAELAHALPLWQGFGMMMAIFGVGYAIAARDPIKHWLLIFVSLLGKVLGPVGFLLGVLKGQLAWAAGRTFLTDDVMWWVPFAWMLYHAYQANQERRS